MATVSAGSINLTSNISVESGHHVATTDLSRIHVSDRRPPVGTGRQVTFNSTAGQFLEDSIPNEYIDYPRRVSEVGNTVYGIKTHNQILDYSQFGYYGNEYIESLDYIETSQDYVRPQRNKELTHLDDEECQYNLEWAYRTQPSVMSYHFDFADYIGIEDCDITVYYDITVRSDTSSAAKMRVNIQATASPQNGNFISGTDQSPGSEHDQGTTGSGSVTYEGVDNDQGQIYVQFALTRINAWNDTTTHVFGTGEPLARISNVRASITATGRTRINTSNVTVRVAATGHDNINTPAASEDRDHSVKWSGFDFSGTITPGQPVIHGLVAHSGLLQTRTDAINSAGIPYTVKYGHWQNAQTISLLDTLIPEDCSLVIRNTGTDIHIDDLIETKTGRTTSGHQNFFILGSSAYGYDTDTSKELGVRDIPQVVSHTTLTDANVSISQSANLEIEYRYVRPLYDLTNSPTFMQARLLLNPPFLSEDLDFTLDSTVSTDVGLAVSDPQDIEPGVNINSNFVGGITQFADKDLTVSTAIQTVDAETGVIIDGGSVDFVTSFEQKEQYQIEFAYTANFVGNQRHQPTKNITWSFGQAEDATAVGVIIDNAETETFEFSVIAVPLVFVVPDRYRELLIEDESRRYPVPAETRDYAVNTESRRYAVPEETRDAQVETETRVITEKGYTA